MSCRFRGKGPAGYAELCGLAGLGLARVSYSPGESRCVLKNTSVSVPCPSEAGLGGHQGRASPHPGRRAKNEKTKNSLNTDPTISIDPVKGWWDRVTDSHLARMSREMPTGSEASPMAMENTSALFRKNVPNGTRPLATGWGVVIRLTSPAIGGRVVPFPPIPCPTPIHCRPHPMVRLNRRVQTKSLHFLLFAARGRWMRCWHCWRNRGVRRPLPKIARCCLATMTSCGRMPLTIFLLKRPRWSKTSWRPHPTGDMDSAKSSSSASNKIENNSRNCSDLKKPNARDSAVRPGRHQSTVALST